MQVRFSRDEEQQIPWSVDDLIKFAMPDPVCATTNTLPPLSQLISSHPISLFAESDNVLCCAVCCCGVCCVVC